MVSGPTSRRRSRFLAAARPRNLVGRASLQCRKSRSAGMTRWLTCVRRSGTRSPMIPCRTRGTEGDGRPGSATVAQAGRDCQRRTTGADRGRRRDIYRGVPHPASRPRRSLRVAGQARTRMVDAIESVAKGFAIGVQSCPGAYLRHPSSSRPVRGAGDRSPHLSGRSWPVIEPRQENRKKVAPDGTFLPPMRSLYDGGSVTSHRRAGETLLVPITEPGNVNFPEGRERPQLSAFFVTGVGESRCSTAAFRQPSVSHIGV